MGSCWDWKKKEEKCSHRNQQRLDRHAIKLSLITFFQPSSFMTASSVRDTLTKVKSLLLTYRNTQQCLNSLPSLPRSVLCATRACTRWKRCWPWTSRGTRLASLVEWGKATGAGAACRRGPSWITSTPRTATPVTTRTSSPKALDTEPPV